MDNAEFVAIAVKTIQKFLDKTYSNSINLPDLNIYQVWGSKTLQNNKGMFASDLPDGRYYEVTYNGDKEELYFDVYGKMLNEAIAYTSKKGIKHYG